MSGKPRILFMQAKTEPIGGKEAVFAWALQSLCSACDVTVFTWSSSVDTAGFNRQYGTSLRQTDIQLLRPAWPLRAYARLLAALDPDPASILPAVLLMRLTRRVREPFRLTIATEMETDFGPPGLQYIHYPWLGEFSQALEATENLPAWRKFIALCRGSLRPWMWLGDFSLRRMRANQTLVNSDWTGSHFQAAYRTNTTTLYPPATGVFPAVPWHERENGFLCIGRIHPDKRLDWIIHALQPLRAEIPDLHLHIVGKVGDMAGEQQYFRQLRQHATDAGWITLYPDLSRQDLEALAVRQRYGIHAMIDEHFGIAIAEMLRAGCIPFVHDSGGAVEIVGNEPRLLYQSAEDLQSRILHVAQNPAERHDLASALSRSAERFSSGRFMENLLQIVESTLNANQTAAQVSLILPLLRQNDAWLRQAVLSALHQTVACDVLVVLSPATPASNRQVLAELQASYPSLRILERPAGMRFAAALNLGIRSSSGPRVGFLLSDDWLDPRAVELCLCHDTDIVSTGLQAWKADGKTRLRHITGDWTRAEYDRRPTFAEKAHYLSYFFLYRRTALEAIGGLDESLGDSPGIDDWDLPWSLLENGATVSIVEQRLYNCRDHEGERLTTRHQDDMMATFLRVLDKHRVTGPLREKLLRENAPSFGRSLQAVYNSSGSWPVRKLREAYRTALPIHFRRAIQDRLIDPVLNLSRLL